MTKTPKSKDKIEDEPGVEERFMHGIKNVLKTPPKPFTPKAKGKGGTGKPGK